MIKKLAAAVLLVAVLFSAGCVTGGGVAEQGDTVSVYYTLTLDDGSVQDTNVGGTPLSFVLGGGQMIAGFDAAVTGMKVGETKTVRLSPADGYGEITEDMMQEIPLATLEAQVGGTVSAGDVYQVTVNTDAGYQRAFLKVLSVEGDMVSAVLAGSHLVGEYLTFTITLDAIQK